MAERHDNTKPASGGTFSLSRLGLYTYLPIEKGEGFTRPFQAVCLRLRSDGTLLASLDVLSVSPLGEVDE